jgi:hypothetical protein
VKRKLTLRATLGVIGMVLLAPVMFETDAHAMETAKAEDTVEGYIGVGGSGIGRLQRRFEEEVGACLKKEGFEYYPENGSQAQTDAFALQSKNRADFVKKFGYGISTVLELPKIGTKSKQDQYLDKLSKADKRAFNVAFLGVDPDKPSAAGQAPGLDTKSCLGKAQKAIFGDIAALTALGQKFEDLAKRVNSDAKVVRAVREWSACMKKGGFSFTKESDANDAISNRLSKILGSSNGGFGAQDLSKVDRPGLSKLQKDELAQAKVDWECSTKHLGARNEVAKELNKLFIKDNKAALDKVKSVFGGK